MSKTTYKLADQHTKAIKRTLMGTASFICMVAISNATIAQVGTADVGKVQERIDTGKVVPQSEASEITDIPELPLAPQSGDSSQKFTLKGVELEGVTVYDSAALTAMLEKNYGQRVSLNSSQALARALTNKYRADGYILSQAIIPEQRVSNGILKIRVVEGFVDQVFIEGEHAERGHSSIIEGYGKKIRAERPLNSKTLERYLLLADDLPGASARGVIRPSTTTFGAADLVIVLEHKKFQGSFTTDNRGTEFLGPHQHQGTLAFNSLFGMYDRTLVRGLTTSPTDELRFFDIQHEQQIGSEGTRVRFTAGFAQTEPGFTLSPLNVEGESESYQLRVTHPFIRSRGENLTARAELEYRDTDTDILGFDITNDKIRALRIGASYDWADAQNGVNLIDAEISQGLDVFGATGPGVGRSRADGEEDFTKINMDFSRLQTLPRGFSLLTAASAQYAFDPLLSPEEFSLGGVGFGQAYDPSEIASDHGAAAKIEVRWGNAVNKKYLRSYQLYGYYDIGAVWNKDTPAGTSSRASLANIGTGVRANINEHFSGNAEVALPLTRNVAVEGDEDPRFFFSVTGRF